MYFMVTRYDTFHITQTISINRDEGVGGLIGLRKTLGDQSLPSIQIGKKYFESQKSKVRNILP